MVGGGGGGGGVRIKTRTLEKSTPATRAVIRASPTVRPTSTPPRIDATAGSDDCMVTSASATRSPVSVLTSALKLVLSPTVSSIGPSIGPPGPSSATEAIEIGGGSSAGGRVPPLSSPEEEPVAKLHPRKASPTTAMVAVPEIEAHRGTLRSVT